MLYLFLREHRRKVWTISESSFGWFASSGCNFFFSNLDSALWKMILRVDDISSPVYVYCIYLLGICAEISMPYFYF